MTRRALALVVLAACTSAVPAPEPVVIPIPVSAPPSGGRAAPTPASAPTSGRGSRDVPPSRAVKDAGDTTIRVLLSANTSQVRIAAPGGVLLTDRDGSMLARVARDEVWRVEQQQGGGRRVRAVRPDGVGTIWIDGPLYAHAIGDALLSIAGRPYRGEAAVLSGDSGVVVVNVVKIDDYLRGVVPLEIGTTQMGDSAAVQAQAVTARSYAFTHLASAMRPYDVTGGVLDQVYGGVAAETAVASQAVESTRTLVLEYAGRVVNAPYHSTCGGSTAAASEVWRSNDEPYLQPVSDRIPGTGRYYCDLSASFHWTRTMDAASLNAVVARYLANYVSVPGRKPGSVRDVTVASHTASGRVGTLTITTDRGNFVLRGNDIRFVLRSSGGEILNSTYFSVETTPASDGSLARLTLHGMGYGHGVGMCQWGAIGRARAGQDFRTILRTYYPGTSVGPAL